MNSSKSSTRFSFSACAKSCARCLLLMKSSMPSTLCCILTRVNVLSYLSVWRKHASLEKGSGRVPSRRDDASHGRPLERYDSVASAGWAETHQRTQAFHSRDHRTHAHPASSGTCCRWHPQKRRQENDSALRLLLTFPLWKNARPCGPDDVQLGTFAF